MIGIRIDPALWRAKFDACLLTDEEYALGANAWRKFADPFPSWDVNFDEDEDDDHPHDEDHDHDEAGHRHSH
jgi:hypothetical protein